MAGQGDMPSYISCFWWWIYGDDGVGMGLGGERGCVGMVLVWNWGDLAAIYTI